LLLNEYVIASWNYETNITDENLNVLVPFVWISLGSLKFNFIQLFQGEVGGRVGAYSDQAFVEASQFDSTNFSPDTKRQLSLVGSQSLSDEEMNELYDIQNQMGNIYASYQVRHQSAG
jgi:hypothetical protein